MPYPLLPCMAVQTCPVLCVLHFSRSETHCVWPPVQHKVQRVSTTRHPLLAAAVTFTLQDLGLTVGLTNLSQRFLLANLALHITQRNRRLKRCQRLGILLELQLALQPCVHQCDVHSVQVEVQALHITRRDLPDADASPEQWQTLMGTPIDTPKQNNFIMLCDPSFSQVPDLISGGHLRWRSRNSHTLQLIHADHPS